MGTAYQEQAKVFKALCDPKRLAILEQLRSGLLGILRSAAEQENAHEADE